VLEEKVHANSQKTDVSVEHVLWPQTTDWIRCTTAKSVPLSKTHKGGDLSVVISH